MAASVNIGRRLMCEQQEEVRGQGEGRNGVLTRHCPSGEQLANCSLGSRAAHTKVGILTLKFNRGTQAFFKIDMRHEAYRSIW